MLPMRDKVLAAITDYAEGRPIKRACKDHELGIGTFYNAIETDPPCANAYRAAKKALSHKGLEQMREVIDDMSKTPEEWLAHLRTLDLKGLSEPQIASLLKGPDPRSARVILEGLRKLIELYNREEYGERSTVELEVKPSLLGAIAAGKIRSARPPRDLDQENKPQILDITPVLLSGTPDNESGDVLNRPDAADLDPFEP